MFYIVPFIINSVLAFFVIVIINWLYKLEKNKCDCSINKKYKQIKYYWYFILSIFVISILLNIFLYTAYVNKFLISNDLLGMNIIFLIFVCLWHIYNSYNTYTYIYELDDNKCLCGGKTIQREFVYIYSIIFGILGCLMIIPLFIFLIVYVSTCGLFNNHSTQCNKFYDIAKTKKNIK